MKRLSFVTLCFLQAVAFAQNSKDFPKFDLLPRIGAGVQHYVFVEAGVQFSDEISKLEHWQNIYFSTDFFFKQKFTIAPKLGYEKKFSFMGAGAALVFYTDFEQAMPAFAPSVSFWKTGNVHASYSYVIPLNNQRVPGINLHRICLVIDWRFGVRYGGTH
jgi:hypothetical protein